MLRLKRRNQRGDTIVEVMIVLAVLGSAIGISYATANRSLLNARQAQESARATVIAQSQVEELRALAPISDSHNDNYIYSSALPFCLNRNNSGNVVRFDSAIVYPDNCKYDQTTDFEYDVKITYDNTSGDDKFTISVVYADILGEGQDSVTLTYRVHQDDAAYFH
ncbi:MAG TPA: prepilin-type N-terminal cleavage/methylation domain-containing protein [Candidatus Saccharimonadales bacterium]